MSSNSDIPLTSSPSVVSRHSISDSVSDTSVIPDGSEQTPSFLPSGGLFDVSDYVALATSPETQLSKEEKNPSRRNVLVLEDDPTQLLILQQHLESLELHTISASTIAEARQHLKEHTFELAVFDVQLPDGSGLEFCREIDDHPDYMGLPVVVLSNQEGNNIVRDTRASGGCYYISKPYDPNVLLAVIERLIGEMM